MKIGILGAGQLGQMLALAGIPLGLRFVFLDPKADAPGGAIAPQIIADFDDSAALDQLAGQVDLVTFDFENVPVASARRLAERCPVYPNPDALAVGQDRLAEKQLFQRLGIPTAPFRAVDSYQELKAAVSALGLPAIVKTRRFGYDGKGQFHLQRAEQVEAAWRQLGGRPLLLEGVVNFEREVSVLAARSRRAEIKFYPVPENHHRTGILRRSRAPLGDPALARLAENYGQRVLTALDYVGVLAIEFFVVDGRLLANEMAPRVHNSGHWTIEGAVTSQFENHLRAVLGWPLGATDPVGHSVMLNCIGREPRADAVLAIPGAHLHSYGKRPQPGRKLGHVTLCADGPAALAAAEAAARALIEAATDDPPAGQPV